MKTYGLWRPVMNGAWKAPITLPIQKQTTHTTATFYTTADYMVHYTSSATKSKLHTGLLIFRGKKSKISRDFQGQIRRKIGRFRGIFAGKESKFAEQSVDFGRFSRKKSQNSQKNRPISRDFSGKKSIFRRIFRGKFLGKSADFTGNFGGKLRQETISKKQPISLGFFWANFAKIDQFCGDMTSVGERFF